jgi:hypothetical protein
MCRYTLAPALVAQPPTTTQIALPAPIPAPMETDSSGNQSTVADPGSVGTAPPFNLQPPTAMSLTTQIRNFLVLAAQSILVLILVQNLVLAEQILRSRFWCWLPAGGMHSCIGRFPPSSSRWGHASQWARFGRSALQTLNCCSQRTSCAPRGGCSRRISKGPMGPFGSNTVCRSAGPTECPARPHGEVG